MSLYIGCSQNILKINKIKLNKNYFNLKIIKINKNKLILINYFLGEFNEQVK